MSTHSHQLDILIYADDPSRQLEAGTLGAGLGIEPVHQLPGHGQILTLTRERIELRTLGKHAPGPVYADFVAGPVAHRRKFGGGRGQLLPKAAGIKGGYLPDVIDATAGLGRDAFVLASLGCQVRMIERSPIVAALLADGLRRAAADADTCAIAARMTLVSGDAITQLAILARDSTPDVIVVDPMFPDRGKAALAKKEMQAFQGFVGDDLDAPILLHAALNIARRRVIVKRPRLAPAIEGPPPTVQIMGQSTRFDVYVISGQHSS